MVVWKNILNKLRATVLPHPRSYFGQSNTMSQVKMICVDETVWLKMGTWMRSDMCSQYEFLMQRDDASMISFLGNWWPFLGPFADRILWILVGQAGNYPACSSPASASVKCCFWVLLETHNPACSKGVLRGIWLSLDWVSGVQSLDSGVFGFWSLWINGDPNSWTLVIFG